MTVGLLTDQALENKKALPLLSFEQRREILESLDCVDEVVAQDAWEFDDVLDKYQPKVFVHGDKWDGPLQGLRDRVVQKLNSYGGTFVELPYSHEFDNASIAPQMTAALASPYARQKAFRRLMQSHRLVRILEAHSPLAALIGETCRWSGMVRRCNLTDFGLVH